MNLKTLPAISAGLLLLGGFVYLYRM